jgi:hypothetical protein
MDIDSAPLEEVEEYLRSFGGHWAAIPEALTRSLRERQPEDDYWEDKETQEAIAKARLRCYGHAIREFASVCRHVNG